MAKYFEINLLFVLISSFLVAFSLSHPLHEYPITTCLKESQVTNFSVIPTPTYYHFLNFSLQNLRFARPYIPKPHVVILPESREQLVRSLLCSRKGGYEIRVRCGGHSFEGLSSVVFNAKTPFVIIDLMNLNNVEVDLDSKTAWVEGGATLGELFYAIAEQSNNKYGFSAGSCPTVGSGGHISGGGFGYISRKYGLAADNVVDALLVGPDGQVLDREAMGEDVFWAIRGGGGGSFGIVYKWRINLLEIAPTVTVLQAPRYGNIEAISQLVHQWQYVGPFLDGNFSLLVRIKSSTVSGVGYGVVPNFHGFYHGPKDQAISILNEAFPDLGIQDYECSEMSWIDSVMYFSNLPSGSPIEDLKNRYLQDKYYYKAKSDYVMEIIPLEGVRRAMEMISLEPKGLIWLDPYGAKMAEIPSDAIPFPHREGSLINIQYMVVWQKNDDEKRVHYLAWIRRFYELMTPYVSSNPRAAYVNFIDLDLGEDWGHQYFLKNYERLVKAKTIIDPCNVFRHPQGIAPNPSYSKKVCFKSYSYYGKWNSRTLGGRKVSIAKE